MTAEGTAQTLGHGDSERPRSGAGARLARRLADSPEIGIIAALIAAVAVFTSINPLFLSVSDLQNPLGVDLAGFGILAVGESFVIITGGIDLSVGSLAAFFVVVAAIILLFALSIVMERLTPPSSQAVVQAYVVCMPSEVAGRVIVKTSSDPI